MNLSVFLGLLLLAHQAFAAPLEKPVRFQSHDGYDLRGRLSYPQDKEEKSPGILLIHGSGALDMNLWLPGAITTDGKPAKMFQTLAHALSDQGAVVLRYNKRGVMDKEVGPPSVDISIFTTADVTNLVEDVKSALALLKSDPYVDPQKIILLGISEGTILAPLVAENDPDIAGMVLMSSVGQSMRDIIYFQQVERSLTLAQVLVDKNHDGYLEASEALAFPELALPIAVLDINGDNKVSMAELKSALLSQHYAGLEAMLTGPLKTWFRQHFSMPANFINIEKFKKPILMLHGEVDAQTPLSDAFLISQKLKQAGQTNFNLETFPGLGHGFSPHKGSNGVIPTVGPIDPTVIQSINSWVQSTF